MQSPEVVGVVIDPAQLGQPPLLAPVDVSLNGGLARADQASVPQTETAEAEETSRAHEGLVEDERLPREHPNIEVWIFHLEIEAAITPPVFIELLKENLEAKCHDEAASNHSEHHVEEEVSVVVMTHTVIEPGAVMVHLEDARVADTEIARCQAV